MSTPPPITGVAEIVLNALDLPALRDFYRDTLGFRLLSESCHEPDGDPDATGEPTIAFLVIAEVETPLGRNGHPQLLAVIDHRRHAASKPKFEDVAARQSTLNHVAFEIPPASYEAHRSRLEALSLSPVAAAFPNMNAMALFFQDPEGNTVELICHEPRVPTGAA